jgi:hypothetical protein
MNLNLVLECCAAEGVAVSIDGGKLVITGQPAALDEWRPVLRSIKAELLALLAGDLVLVEQRAAHFIKQNVKPATARALALRLNVRDAQHDERRLCLECSHLFDTSRTHRCAQWRQAGHGGPQLPSELPILLQRCKGFHLADIKPAGQPTRHTKPAGSAMPARPATYFEGATP